MLISKKILKTGFFAFICEPKGFSGRDFHLRELPLESFVFNEGTDGQLVPDHYIIGSKNEKLGVCPA